MTVPRLSRFFFHVVSDRQSYRDDQGEVFASVEAARNHAVRIAYELRHDAYQDCTVCVFDAAGGELTRVPIGSPTDINSPPALACFDP